VHQILVDRREDGTAVLTVHPPEPAPASTLDAVRELVAVLDVLAEDASVRVVVITGGGSEFCFEGAAEDAEGSDTVPVQRLLSDQSELASLVSRVRSLPQPVIAAVNGPATGLGLGLVLASDIRVAAASARFRAGGAPSAGLPGCEAGLSFLLPRTVGLTAAFAMVLGGSTIDAAEAERLGLVLRVVPADELLTAALEVAGRILANSPFGVRMTKEVMWANLEAPSLQAAMELEIRNQLLCAHTKDQGEAVAAFLERRPPLFVDA
jgi:enoyl-CoA hydratase